MAYQQKPGDCAVFKVKEKRSDRAPDWTGTLVIPEGAKSGDKLDVALWTKNDGFLAGNVKAPREQQQREGVKAQNESRGDPHRDDGRHVLETGYADYREIEDDERPF